MMTMTGAGARPVCPECGKTVWETGKITSLVYGCAGPLTDHVTFGCCGTCILVTVWPVDGDNRRLRVGMARTEVTAGEAIRFTYGEPVDTDDVLTAWQLLRDGTLLDRIRESGTIKP
jgi:hypothetical protein